MINFKILKELRSKLRKASNSEGGTLETFLFLFTFTLILVMVSISFLSTKYLFLEKLEYILENEIGKKIEIETILDIKSGENEKKGNIIKGDLYQKHGEEYKNLIKKEEDRLIKILILKGNLSIDEIKEVKEIIKKEYSGDILLLITSENFIIKKSKGDKSILFKKKLK